MTSSIANYISGGYFNNELFITQVVYKHKQVETRELPWQFNYDKSTIEYLVSWILYSM